MNIFLLYCVNQLVKINCDIIKLEKRNGVINMRKNFGPKTWSYCEPVFIIGTYNEDGTANAMNAAWAGIYDTNKVFVSLSSHKTTDNFKRTKAFTISFGTKDELVASDYVGIVSGNKEPNKVEKAGWHYKRSEFVDAPYFEELKMSLDCSVDSIQEDEDGIKLIGNILNVSADESILTDGKIDPLKLKPLIFDPVNNKYLVATEVAGDAFKSGLLIRNK